MPQMSGLTDEMRAVVRIVAQNMMDIRKELAGQFGPLPYDYVKGTREEQLEQYFVLRDDPAAWPIKIAEAATILHNRKLAEYSAVVQAAQQEKALVAAGGPLAVRAALTMQRVGKAARAVQKAERMLDRAPIQVLPPLPPVPSDLEMLGVDPALLDAAMASMGEGVSQAAPAPARDSWQQNVPNAGPIAGMPPPPPGMAMPGAA